MAHKLTARRLKEIASLQVKKYRERHGEMVIEGVRSVESAIHARAPLVEIIVAEDALGDERLRTLLEKATVPVHIVSAGEAGRLSDVETSPGVLAVSRLPLQGDVALRGAQHVLVLDGIQDPGNVGTIIRTAAWFGVDVVVAGPGTTDFFSPKVVRAAMGGLWDVQLVQSTALEDTLEMLRASGSTLYGADMEGDDARRWAPESRSALVLGSEAHGVSPEVRRLLDGRITIGGTSKRRGTESLNVAIAAGILVYEWLGGRQQGDG